MKNIKSFLISAITITVSLSLAYQVISSSFYKENKVNKETEASVMLPLAEKPISPEPINETELSVSLAKTEELVSPEPTSPNADIETDPSLSLSKTESPNTNPKNPDKEPTSEKDRTFSSFLDFPYDDILFADDKAYEFIKEAYSRIDFSSEFKRGNFDLYDFYKEKYNQLLKSEIPFTDPKKSEELYLYEYSKIESYSSPFDCTLNEHKYYFFDMDEDDAPELCIVNNIYCTYIFKYKPDLDKVILWRELPVCWYMINGSRTICWNREAIRHVFYKLDADGEAEYAVSFFLRDGFNRKINQGEVVFMVSLPRYADKTLEVDMPEEIKNQAYFDSIPKAYFRVTEEQYHELTDDYFKALKIAETNIDEVTFTYDELFGEDNLSE